MREPACPICNADVPLSGDEQPGEELHCAYCRSPIKIKASDDDDIELEEDF